MDLKPFNHSSDLSVIGIDEAGRGPLAGTVVAAAVILPSGFQKEGSENAGKTFDPGRRSAASRSGSDGRRTRPFCPSGHADLFRFGGNLKISTHPQTSDCG